MAGTHQAYMAETITLTEPILSACFGSVVRLESAPRAGRDQSDGSGVAAGVLLLILRIWNHIMWSGSGEVNPVDLVQEIEK
jgi:hypothetical protein